MLHLGSNGVLRMVGHRETDIRSVGPVAVEFFLGGFLPPSSFAERVPMIRPTLLFTAALLIASACGDDTSSGLSPVSLGSAGNYAVLAKSAVTTTGVTAVVGNVGLSPAAATFITGFNLSAPATSFTTSSLVSGRLYASNYAVPTPANLTDAVSDMESAYTDAAGRTHPDHTELGAGNIQGMTLAPGLYKWGTGVSIPSAVTLSGGSNDVWIFQIAQDLTVGSAAVVTLAGGARAKNVFWQVGGAATLGTTSNFKGIILSQTAITFNTGSIFHGRALAQTAVTLSATAVTQP